MAYSAPNLEIYFKIIGLLLLMNVHQSTPSKLDLPSHVHKDNLQPLILVLDDSGNMKIPNIKSRAELDSREENRLNLPLLLQQLLKGLVKKPAGDFRRPKQHDRDEDNKKENRFWVDKTNRDRKNRVDLDRDDNRHEHHDHRDDHNSNDGKQKNHVHGSPVVKNLLRISNTLRCGARNECEDECSNNYGGKRRDQCENECEKNISCEEEQSEEKGCDRSEEGRCNVSTKGYRLETSTSRDCKRC